MRFLQTTLAVLLAVPAFAQRYEFGLNGGGSFTLSKTVSSSRGDAKAGFENGWSAGFTLGHNMYEHVGGEIRYTFQAHDAKVSSGGTKATFGAQSHAIHYDFLIHTAPTKAHVRPYVAVGGGIRHFRGTGTENAFQPLSAFAILTKTTQTVGMASFGAGVKLRFSDRISFRVDVHDYLSPFPKDVITPGRGASIGGWLNNIVPSAGITFTF